MSGHGIADLAAGYRKLTGYEAAEKRDRMPAVRGDTRRPKGGP
jgi:hypothetical protein